MYRAILTALAVAILAALQPALSSSARAGGLASFYGNDFAGRPTANGETFNPGALTAASLSLPFGTIVRVTNRRNGRSVDVRINDRGPYVGGRVIDLSLAAASAIGMINSGVASVDIEVIGSRGGTQVASLARRHHRAAVEVAARSTRHHHAAIQVASARASSRQIALGMSHHRRGHGQTQLASVKLRHHHTRTTIATGDQTNAEGFTADGADSNSDTSN